MNKKLLLFDIDKTLIDEMKLEDSPWPSSFEEVYGINCPITLKRVNSHGMTHKQIAIETMINKGLKEEEIVGKLDLFIKTLEKHYDKSLENAKIILFPKITELLQHLFDEGHILGLVTGNTKKIAYGKLRNSGVDKFFSIGGFGDDSPNRKELVTLALKRAEEKYGFKPHKKNVFIIGDTPNDIIAGKDFDLQTIGVSTGLYSKEDLTNAGADFVLDNLQDKTKFLSIIHKDA